MAEEIQYNPCKGKIMGKRFICEYIGKCVLN